MDFESAKKYLKSFVSYENLPEFDYNERNFNLERLGKFVRDYGIDYSGVKFVHVAGSKGKGSVCSLIASYLKEAGHKTGLFTSPYMFDIRESFWLDGENISEEKFVRYIEDLKSFIDANGGELTYFELLFVLVMKYFVGEGASWVVLEVGLGGRLDATNVVVPELSILTTVEKEHTTILGESLSEILDEKLGIVKKGVPLLVGYQGEEVTGLIREKMKGKVQIFFVEDFVKDFESLGLKSLSRVQVKNGEVVFCALKILFGNVNKGVFRRVFEEFRLVGRFDVREISGRTVVFDIAHTEASVRNLVESLRVGFSGKKFIFLVSVMRGKDVYGILDLISKIADKVIFTSSHEERGYGGSELKAFSSGIYDEVEEDPVVAYKKALKNLGKDHILVVTGSHFLIDKIL